jgi:hypothetical protein
VFRFLLWAILAALKPKALVVAENRCLRQQLLVLQRRQPRPYLKTADRLFWVLASRWLGGWRNLLLIVKPQTVSKWHQRGWRLYWSWRSRMRPRTGRRAIPQQLQVLIRRRPRKTSFGVKNEYRPSWQGWGSRCPPGPWPSTCRQHATIEALPCIGEHF